MYTVVYDHGALSERVGLGGCDQRLAHAGCSRCKYREGARCRVKLIYWLLSIVRRRRVGCWRFIYRLLICDTARLDRVVAALYSARHSGAIAVTGITIEYVDEVGAMWEEWHGVESGFKLCWGFAASLCRVRDHVWSYPNGALVGVHCHRSSSPSSTWTLFFHHVLRTETIPSPL
jgi:hypothetical protein